MFKGMNLRISLQWWIFSHWWNVYQQKVTKI